MKRYWEFVRLARAYRWTAVYHPQEAQNFKWAARQMWAAAARFQPLPLP